MEYTVAFGSPDELVKVVNDKMQHGWEPQGGISVVCDSLLGHIAFQAMRKRRDEAMRDIKDKPLTVN